MTVYLFYMLKIRIFNGVVVFNKGFNKPERKIVF